MDRRTFLAAGAGGLFTGCNRFRAGSGYPLAETTLNLPGQKEGHMLRDATRLPAASSEMRAEVVVIGSGAAGLTCAWKLSKSGMKNVLVVSGPELGGNTHAGSFGDLRFPQGAHYLPVPTPESTHVRELLADLGILHGSARAPAPAYDEADIVHSPSERIYHQGKWQYGLYPETGLSPEETRERTRFLTHMETLKGATGADGKRIFAIPSALSSQDPAWRALDALTLRQWLDKEGYKTALLHWHADYCCRDDFGAPSTAVSAWAGLHYFTSRTGEAANAPEHGVLTWPEGLSKLSAAMVSRNPEAQVAGTAFRVTQNNRRSCSVDVLIPGPAPRVVRIVARKVVCATPLFVASRLFGGMPEYAKVLQEATPRYAPWLVTNFLLNGFPDERAGANLSWDNVVAGSESLGYVVSTHQLVRQARPAQTVFSAYRSFDKDPKAVRQWMMAASKEELLKSAGEDLVTVYGDAFWENVTKVEVTLRGHAMAIPAPGFRSKTAIKTLQRASGDIQFAHADLSGFSIFEEASWWGWRAAEKLAG